MKLAGSRYLVHAGFWLATALMLSAAAWTLYNTTTKFEIASASVAHTQGVLQDLGEINETVGSADAAQRSYLLSGAEWSLAVRNRALQGMEDAVARTKRETADNPAQQLRISVLERLIVMRRAIMDEGERLRATRKIDPVQARAAAGDALEISAKIYSVTAEMRHEEIGLLAQRTAEAELRQRTGIGVLVAALLIGVLILVPGYLGYLLQARALRQTERKLRIMADSLPGAMYQMKIVPRGTPKITFVSAGVSRIRRIDPADGDTLPSWNALVEAIDERDRPGFVAAMAESTRTISPVSRDYRVTHADGTVRWLHHDASIQKEEDGSILVNGYVRDISDEKRLLEALQQAKESAVSADRAKSTFLATMSHEIRTPMNGMFGLLELVSLTKLDPEQRTTIEIVRESGKSLLRIIDDILDFSKIEAGKLEIHPETASIREVFGHVHNIYAGSASSKGLLIKNSVDPRISPAVLIDPLRLRQILGNFMSNALKFTSRGSIEMRADLVARDDGRDTVRFSVIDTGIGISAADQERLFQPFSQGEGESTRRAGGTGLGLTICRRLAEMMDGTVEMVSEPGYGTTMILELSLPIADPADLPKDDAASVRDRLSITAKMHRMAPSVAQAQAEGTLVLLVDDHPTNRTLLVRQVNALGYAAESAGNGIEALEKWKSGRFSMVITDCNMPEMDGYELARCIRELESTTGARRVPIISCTANALGTESAICMAAGMDDCLVKPVELSEILKRFDQWLPIPKQDEPAAVAPDVPACPIDRSVLADILGGNVEMELEILHDFRSANDADAAVMEQAVAARDVPLVTRATHRMLGASRLVGAFDFASVCERIGHASRASDSTTVAAGMIVFHQEWARLNAYLDAV